MPELPEVETIKKQLTQKLVGQKIADLFSKHPRSMFGDPKSVIGQTIKSVRRLGKMLIIDLNNDLVIAVHLKMSGQLLFQNKSNQSQISGKHIRVVFSFQSGDKLFFNDQRIFGWVKVMSVDELSQLSYLKKLGPEPWDISDEEFYNRLHHKNKPIKTLLMDQDVVSGVGNIYANDGLWEAGIDPRKKAKMLNRKDAQRLRIALVKVLKEGIKYGGATARDDKYVNSDGTSGQYQKYFRVYDRQGKKCLKNDGGVINKIILGGRGTYFCPRCQK